MNVLFVRTNDREKNAWHSSRTKFSSGSWRFIKVVPFAAAMSWIANAHHLRCTGVGRITLAILVQVGEKSQLAEHRRNISHVLRYRSPPRSAPSSGSLFERLRRKVFGKPKHDLADCISRILSSRRLRLLPFPTGLDYYSNIALPIRHQSVRLWKGALLLLA